MKDETRPRNVMGVPSVQISAPNRILVHGPQRFGLKRKGTRIANLGTDSKNLRCISAGSVAEERCNEECRKSVGVPFQFGFSCEQRLSGRNTGEVGS